MRFIIDIYRYVILAICALVTIGVALLLLIAVDSSGPLQLEYGADGFALAVLLILLFILNVGAVAVLVSIHDRHAELADSAEKIADALRRIADRADNAGRDAPTVSE